MNYITEEQFQKEMKKEILKNKSRERGRKLKEEREKYKKHFKLPSTSKLIAVYLFVILNVVLIFAMVSMWKFADLSYLGVLITDVVAQILTYFIYAKKATLENTVGGITYDIAMKNQNNDACG